MATDPPQPPEPAEESEERSSRVRLWLIVLAVLALVVCLIVYSYADWPGARYFGIADKDFWDYLKLLIVPAALAIGVAWLNWAQSRREREAEEAQKARELAVQNQRAQDTVIQAYVDKMSELLLDNALTYKIDPYDATRVTARLRTSVTLAQLDGAHKRSIVQFLYEAQLINRWNKKLSPNDDFEFQPRIVGLAGADLRNAYLRYLTLEGVALNGAILENADLRNAQLSWIDLGGAYLSGADLGGAYLSEASLQYAQLQPKDELSLRGADLSGSDLSGTDLRGANLSGTNLYEATGWTEEQLTAAWSLEGATMPNGQKYEDWLKSKDQEENKKSDGSS